MGDQAKGYKIFLIVIFEIGDCVRKYYNVIPIVLFGTMNDVYRIEQEIIDFERLLYGTKEGMDHIEILERALRSASIPKTSWGYTKDVVPQYDRLAIIRV